MRSRRYSTEALPLLDGSLAPALFSTIIEAWLVEAWGALRGGDRTTARRALSPPSATQNRGISCAPSRLPAAQLSIRERDVLDEIASDLAVSVNTIKSHVRAIYGKLGVNTRRTAVLTALDQGLLT